MKAVILAGGLGTRLSEETDKLPKPMIAIGTRPILWHIMKIYSRFGINDFIICCGYKGYLIKEYFANYMIHSADVTFDLRRNEATIHKSDTEEWTVTLVDTGESTSTAGRLKRVAGYLEGEENFCFTYGDGVGDIDIASLIAFHKSKGTEATLTAVRPPGRFGALEVHENALVHKFSEKPKGDGDWINGGYFVLKTSVLDRIRDDGEPWEGEPLVTLAEEGELAAYKHDGFWQPMDTLREKNILNALWDSGQAPWKIW